MTQANNDTLRNEQWVNVIRQTKNQQSQQFISHSSEFFTHCVFCNAGMYDRDIFNLLWGAVLAASGSILEEADDNRFLNFALDNIVTLARIAAYFNMSVRS